MICVLYTETSKHSQKHTRIYIYIYIYIYSFIRISLYTLYIYAFINKLLSENCAFLSIGNIGNL